MLTFNFWLVGLVQNMAILPTLLGSKWLFLGWGSHLELESVKWTISHPNTWGNIIWGHFCPLHWRVSRYPSRVPDVQKWLCLPKWQAGSRLNCPTWKVSSAPYQIQIHGRARFMTIFALIVGAKERERGIVETSFVWNIFLRSFFTEPPNYWGFCVEWPIKSSRE